MANIDLTGKIFGKLTVIKKAPSILGGKAVKRLWGAWECKCECGEKIISKTVDLNRGSVKSCGCLISEFGKILKPGMKFGKLTTVSYKNGWWTCQCDCGNISKVQTSSLTTGNAKTCGCYRLDNTEQNIKKLTALTNSRLIDPKLMSSKRIFTKSYKDGDLTLEDFTYICQQPCFYCNLNYSNTLKKKSISKYSIYKLEDYIFNYNGLDRINNNIPHNLNNVVPSCKQCNRTKSNLKLQEFINKIQNYKLLPFTPINIQSRPLPNNKGLAASIRNTFWLYKKNTNLSVEEFYHLSQLNCFYCSQQPFNKCNAYLQDKKASQKSKDEYKITGTFIYNGLDRVDNNLGHTKNNIVPCCYNCNWAKHILTLEEFYTWIKRIQTNLTNLIEKANKQFPHLMLNP